MVVFTEISRMIGEMGVNASGLRALSQNPTSKSVVGIVAERTGLQVVETVHEACFDIYFLSDVSGRLKSPFGVICVADKIDNPQQVGVDIDHRMRLKDLFNRTSLVFHNLGLNDVRQHLHYSDIPYAFVDPQLIIDILLGDPPREVLTKQLIASTSLRLLNPYVYRGPIDSRMFVGRVNDLRLLTEMNSSYALVGPRSIGKTSLINRAVHQLRSEGRVAARVEFGENLTEFHLMKKIIQQFVDMYDAWPGYLNRVGAPAIERIVEYTASRTAEKRVFLFVDEADNLTSLCPNLSASLRRLHDDGHLRFVLVGYKELRRNISDSRQDLFNCMARIGLSSIILKDCGALILRPMAEIGITFEELEVIVHLIYQASGGAPSRIQLMCHAMVNLLSDRSSRFIRVDDAQQAIRLPEVREEFFNWYRSSTTPKERAIAAFVTQFPLPMKRNDMIRRIANNTQLTYDEVNNEVEDLIIADVFRENVEQAIDFTFPDLRSLANGGDKASLSQHFRTLKGL